MITLRILLSPGRRGRVVDASGRSVPQPVPAPVIGSAEPLRIILLDPATLDPVDPYGFADGAPLRLTISGDWNPATIPVYATNALERTGVGTYDLADPSGTRTAEALALLGVLAERLCAWELTAYGGDPATEADWAHPLSVVQFDAPLRQRADSLGGDPTEAPAVDLRGPPGTNGTSATVAIGETTTLPAGSPATVDNVGTSSAAVLNFGIPQGALSDPHGLVVATIPERSNEIALVHPYRAASIFRGVVQMRFSWTAVAVSDLTISIPPGVFAAYPEDGATIEDINAGRKNVLLYGPPSSPSAEFRAYVQQGSSSTSDVDVTFAGGIFKWLGLVVFEAESSRIAPAE